MRDAMLSDRRENPCGLDAPQADVRAARRRNRPRIRPAVAVEHRQRPQINAVGVEPERKRIAERVQICAAVVVDNAFRIAGGAGRVEERERIPFVQRARPWKRRIAFV